MMVCNCINPSYYYCNEMKNILADFILMKCKVFFYKEMKVVFYEIKDGLTVISML